MSETQTSITPEEEEKAQAYHDRGNAAHKLKMAFKIVGVSSDYLKKHAKIVEEAYERLEETSRLTDFQQIALGESEKIHENVVKMGESLEEIIRTTKILDRIEEEEKNGKRDADGEDGVSNRETNFL